MAIKSWAESSTFNEKLVTLYGEVAFQLYESEPVEIPEILRDWLARLRLLYGVPFNYLVPNSKLLPKESIRFFYLDRNWTDRLVDGALSVGKTTTREYAHHHALQNTITQNLNTEERLMRPKLRGVNLSKSPVKTSRQSQDTTGLLLRSAVVSGWPGLEVKAYRQLDEAGADPSDKLTLLRMDRLSPDVLFCLFDGIPRVVDVEEPYEGLQFGVDEDTDDNEYFITLRHLKGEKPGKMHASFTEVVAPVRTADRSVLHIEQFVANVNGALSGHPLQPELNNGSTISPAEFAVQMLQFPYIQRFFETGKDLNTGATWGNTSFYADATFSVRNEVPQITEAEQAGLINYLSESALSSILGTDDE